MLLTEQRVRTAARTATASLKKSADAALRESAEASRNHFDVFLSHSTKDAELVLGTKNILEKQFDLSVYVDWVTDAHLDRGRVTAETARTLRNRMKQSEALFYLATEGATESTWMPWELGYFDALKGRVAILPVKKTESSTFTGNEYLGLYPYVDIATVQNSSNERLWVNRSAEKYKDFRTWMTDPGVLDRAH
jgi:hypothetical protein